MGVPSHVYPPNVQTLQGSKFTGYSTGPVQRSASDPGRGLQNVEPQGLTQNVGERQMHVKFAIIEI